MMHKAMAPSKSALRPITLRNLPSSVARAVKERAEADGVSLNKAVGRLLEEALRTARPNRIRTHDDLDDLIGSWSDREAREMQAFLSEQRKVEPERWR
jgi:plasmid stability protein